MLRLLLALMFLYTTPAYSQAVYKGKVYNSPVCNSPNCAMCNYIRAQLQTQVVPSTAYNPAGPDDYYPHEKAADVEYETVQIPVVTRVKRCNGVTCWYENVTTYKTERRPIAKVVNKLLKVIDLVPTPREAVTAMVALANPQPNEVLYDLGCGDGRILIEATNLFGCRSVGIELNSETVEKANYNIDNYGLANKIRVYEGDVLNYTYEHADIVTVYLYPDLIEKLLPKLRKGTRVISYLHPFTGSKETISKGYVFYTRTL